MGKNFSAVIQEQMSDGFNGVSVRWITIIINEVSFAIHLVDSPLKTCGPCFSLSLACQQFTPQTDSNSSAGPVKNLISKYTYINCDTTLLSITWSETKFNSPTQVFLNNTFCIAMRHKDSQKLQLQRGKKSLLFSRIIVQLRVSYSKTLKLEGVWISEMFW